MDGKPEKVLAYLCLPIVILIGLACFVGGKLC